MNAIISLSDIDNPDTTILGGKAANLASLASAGFSVPQAFIVPVDIYKQFLTSNGLNEEIAQILKKTEFDDKKSVALCSKNIKEIILAGKMEKETKERILRMLAEESGRWAVRSSATAEDLPDASFAGQQDTFLGIKSEDVPRYIRKCWASYWNTRALVYRHNARVSHLEGGIAVVVQKMVDARSSGIMFTTDPTRGDTTIVIESSWGLGESIVSGVVSPDRFVCERSSVKIAEKEISNKKKGVFLSEGKKCIREINHGKQRKPSLTEEEIRQLAELGKTIESHFGTPQDIEWSIENGNIYVLQSRPVTTLEKDDEILWTRGYGDEYWADVTSPLFFSLLGEYLTEYVNHEGAEIMGYKELVDTELLRLHKGHIYFNTEVLEQIFTFNPRFSRTKELLDYFPKKDRERIANAKTETLRRIWAEMRIMLLDPDGMISRTDKAYKKWTERFLSKIETFNSLDLTTFSSKELHETFLEMEKAYIKHFQLIRYGIVTHSIGMNLILKRWLHDWLDDESGALYAKLISGLSSNKTVQTNMAIAALAQSARTDKTVKKLLDSLPSHEFLNELSSNLSLAGFNEKFTKFLEAYGHRSHTREMYFPRWKDDPTLVIEILKQLVHTSDRFKEIEKRKVKERIETEKKVLEEISKLKYGFIKKIIFKIVLKYAQKYLMFRENQRFYLDHIIYQWRRLFTEYGRRFVEKGLISNEDDIFFLSKEEIFDIARGDSLDSLKKISQRKKEFEKYRSALPPKFLKGEREFDDIIIEEDVRIVTGTPASPGTAVGRVRVVDSITNLSSVEESEILVTSNTDPGWTCVFSQLNGLITETGGILSHGAVVSREYGIPAVTAVKNATKIFKTGQKIAIDGNKGVVHVMEESHAHR